jgi:hypothetical protein
MTVYTRYRCFYCCGPVGTYNCDGEAYTLWPEEGSSGVLPTCDTYFLATGYGDDQAFYRINRTYPSAREEIELIERGLDDRKMYLLP